MNVPRRTLSLALLCTVPLGFVLGGSTASGQTRLDTRHGTFSKALFGLDVAVVSDLNGDGHAEWMAGRGGSEPGMDEPELRVYSGIDGSLLYVIPGLGDIGVFFLESLADVGDLDLDGVNDFAFGNSNAKVGGQKNTGKVPVYSGATGTKIWTAKGVLSGGGFGASLTSIGDVNGDGIPDLAIGAIGTLNENVWVVDGASGALLFNVQGPGGSDFEFGYSVGTTGDLDGDTVPDFAVGSHSAAQVQYFSGSNGTLLRTVTGGSTFGRCLANLGDVEGDGFQDLLVSQVSINTVHVISGLDGSTLSTVTPTNGVNFGVSLSAAGDLDGDGITDFLVGDDQPAKGPGVVRAYSTRTGGLLFGVRGEHDGDRFGLSVSGGADIDADGLPDFVIGAPWVDAGRHSVGEVSVWSGCPRPPLTYCTPKQNSLGCWPRISATGSTSLSGPDDLNVLAVSVINNQPGFLLFGTAPAALPFGGGTLCVSPPFTRTVIQSSGGHSSPLDCSGTFSFHFSHAVAAGANILPGTTIFAQFVYRDPGSSPAIGLSNAIQLTFCP